MSLPSGSEPPAAVRAITQVVSKRMAKKGAYLLEYYRVWFHKVDCWPLGWTGAL